MNIGEARMGARFVLLLLENGITQANQDIQILRSNTSDYKNRQDFYTKLEPHLEKLSHIVSTFEQSVAIIAKKEQDKLDKDKQESRRFWIILSVTLVVGLFTFV